LTVRVLYGTTEPQRTQRTQRTSKNGLTLGSLCDRSAGPRACPCQGKPHGEAPVFLWRVVPMIWPKCRVRTLDSSYPSLTEGERDAIFKQSSFCSCIFLATHQVDPRGQRPEIRGQPSAFSLQPSAFCLLPSDGLLLSFWRRIKPQEHGEDYLSGAVRRFAAVRFLRGADGYRVGPGSILCRELHAVPCTVEPECTAGDACG